MSEKAKEKIEQMLTYYINKKEYFEREIRTGQDNLNVLLNQVKLLETGIQQASSEKERSEAIISDLNEALSLFKEE